MSNSKASGATSASSLCLSLVVCLLYSAAGAFSAQGEGIANGAPAISNVLHTGGRHLMQGSGGNGGNGGDGGSGGTGGTPGQGGPAGEGGLASGDGIDGTDGKAGRPGGPPALVKPAATVAPTSTTTSAPVLPMAVLSPVLIQSITNATETKSCISTTIFTSKGKTNSPRAGILRVTLLLPNANSPPLQALNVTTYDVKTITLAGIKANNEVSTISIAAEKKLVVEFDDSTNKLEKLNGTTITLFGFLDSSVGQDYKYSAPLQVCP